MKVPAVIPAIQTTAAEHGVDPSDRLGPGRVRRVDGQFRVLWLDARWSTPVGTIGQRLRKRCGTERDDAIMLAVIQ